MKSKKPLIVALTLISLGGFFLVYRPTPLDHALTTEWIENTFPQNPNDETILPFGYTLGNWPLQFQGEPIVTRLTYQKGPPTQFIESMVQIWRPVEVELTLFGPKTLVKGLGSDRWRVCFKSGFSCTQEKKVLWKALFPDEKLHRSDSISLTWFDGLDPLSARGVHLNIRTSTYQIDRFAVITETGAIQIFSLKTVLNPVGLEGRELFMKTLSSLKVKDDLASNRAWAESKIKSVSLQSVKGITDARVRFQRLIQIQNWIYSLLSVDPTQLASYFHLAGTTHLLAMDLLKSKQKYFENQEAWILNFKPLIGTLIAYAKDFKNSELEVKNMEALLQDILIEEKKLSH